MGKSIGAMFRLTMALMIHLGEIIIIGILKLKTTMTGTETEFLI